MKSSFFIYPLFTIQQSVITLVYLNMIRYLIGYLYLICLYRSEEKREEVLEKKYYGRYDICGEIIILNLIAGVGAAVMLFFLIGIIIRFFLDGPGVFE